MRHIAPLWSARAQRDAQTHPTHPTTLLDLPVGRGDVSAGDLGDGTRAAIAHRQFQLALQDLQHAIDAGLAEGAEPPQKWTTDADTLGAERKRLEHIGAAAHAAIDEHRNAAADFG